MRERLDRGLCNTEWKRLFPRARVRHLAAHDSDQSATVLNTHLDLSKGSKPFRFEAMWFRDESSKEVVQHAWDFQVQGSHHYRLAKKFHQVQKDILHWNRNSSELMPGQKSVIWKRDSKLFNPWIRAKKISPLKWLFKLSLTNG